MTRENARTLLPVIQAFVDGKTIQIAVKGIDNDWEDYKGNCPFFDNANLEWRIKPEPREWWISESYAGHDCAYAQKPSLPGIESIHVREVME